MALMIENDPVPMAVDANGVVRIGGTRVPLETVVATFEEGATPEEIVLRYSALGLADVYDVIAYYLKHRAEVKQYIQERDELAETARQELEARYNLVGIRERLLARRIELQGQADGTIGG